ncbi:MAG TPA: hypothetical protein VJS15_01800 [Allosphingosinicella sp.]|nr:hypothetical protein [Allosphingosinicella sp.]
MIWALALTLWATPPVDLPPIDVPYQIMPAFQTYTACVGNHFTADTRADSDDPAEIRQANIDAIAACREVRAEQLARSLDLQTDFRLYRSREEGRAAVRRAFDRFDRDYEIATDPSLGEEQ